jgi:hypothetical protein
MKTMHKRLFAAAVALFAAVAVYAADANIAGTWNLSVTTQRGTRDSSMVLTQSGSELKGTYKGQRGELPVTGTIKGDDFNLSYKLELQGNSIEVKYVGKVEGDSIKGTVDLGAMGQGQFTGKKAG